MTKSNAYKTSWTPERKKAFSEFRTGQKHTAASIEKMRKSALGLNKHYKHTPETRLLMSTQRKGVPKPESFKQFMRESHTGVPLKESTKMKISQTLTGRKIPIETIIKRSLKTKGMPKPAGFAQKERNSH